MRASIEETRSLMHLVLLADRMHNIIQDIIDDEDGITHTVHERMLAALEDEPTIRRVDDIIKNIK